MASQFKDPIIIKHPKGHIVPMQSIYVTSMVEFLRSNKPND